MKRMLINATQREELRVALVDGQKMYDLDIESTSKVQTKSNIYKAKVIRIEPSLEAAFVNYGAERHGFLPLKEISRSLFKNSAGGGRINIRDAISEGQEFVVQVEKEERGNKGAALTTFVSLAGRYLVLMPNNPRAGGVSRQIEGDDRSEAKEAMSHLQVPEGMGLILRTAGIGKSAEELQWDLDYLNRVWAAIDTAAENRSAPFLIYQDSNIVIRAIRDYLRTDIAEILIDDKNLYEQAVEFMQHVMPHNLNKLKFYQDSVPLFSRYQIENQIDSAFSREVRLPAGGSIVIDHTEAMISIDVNSARATKGSDIEETATNTNLEAAEEVARQLRIRDLGGLVVIDFIDMYNNKNQRSVENKLRDVLKLDRARVQVGRISRFGLLEMSRQRLRPSLGEASHIVCPRCEGTGFIRGVQSMALNVLRLIEEEALKDNTSKVVAQMPVDAASFLLNEKRSAISELETRHKLEIIIVPNPNLETPHHQLERLRKQDDEEEQEQRDSYERIADVEPEKLDVVAEDQATQAEAPAVEKVAHKVPKPEASSPSEKISEPGFIRRFFSSLFGTDDKPKKETTKKRPQRKKTASKRDASNRTAGNKGQRNQPRNNHSRKPKGDDDKPQQNRNRNQPKKQARDNSPGNEKDIKDDAQQKSGNKRNPNRRGSRGGKRNTATEKSSGEQAENISTQQSPTADQTQKPEKVESVDSKPVEQPVDKPIMQATTGEENKAAVEKTAGGERSAIETAVALRQGQKAVQEAQPELNKSETTKAEVSKPVVSEPVVQKEQEQKPVEQKAVSPQPPVVSEKEKAPVTVTSPETATPKPAEIPKAEVQKAEVQKTEAPKTEAPKTEAPKTEAPESVKAVNVEVAPKVETPAAPQATPETRVVSSEEKKQQDTSS